jgi:hypothetical protein
MSTNVDEGSQSRPITIAARVELHYLLILIATLVSWSSHGLADVSGQENGFVHGSGFQAIDD